MVVKTCRSKESVLPNLLLYKVFNIPMTHQFESSKFFFYCSYDIFHLQLSGWGGGNLNVYLINMLD